MDRSVLAAAQSHRYRCLEPAHLEEADEGSCKCYENRHGCSKTTSTASPCCSSQVGLICISSVPYASRGRRRASCTSSCYRRGPTECQSGRGDEDSRRGRRYITCNQSSVAGGVSTLSDAGGRVWCSRRQIVGRCRQRRGNSGSISVGSARGYHVRCIGTARKYRLTH